LHLALVTPEWYPDTSGGIATYCRALAREAVKAGHRVTVLAATTAPERRPEATGRLWVLPVHVPRHGAAAAAERFLDAWPAAARLGTPPDCIESAEFGGTAALIAEARDTPPLATRLHTPLTLLLARNDGQQVYPDDADRCQLERRQVAASALLTSPSRWLAAEVARMWNLPAEPEVIPNPLSARWLADSPAPGPRGLPSRVLYAGRLEYRKGVLTLAAAVRGLSDKGIQAEVTFAGGDTVWRGQPMSHHVREALGPSATYTLRPPASRAALRGLIDEASLVVLPSHYENFSYSCLEAMARGKPVIATSGTGFDEIIKDGRTGFLVRPQDPGALRDVLERVIGDAGLRRSVGAAARTAVSRFSAAAIVPSLLARYAAMSPAEEHR